MNFLGALWLLDLIWFQRYAVNKILFIYNSVQMYMSLYVYILIYLPLLEINKNTEKTFS